METVGTILREAREERGETISNAALHTKIGSRYLSALEEDRYESFPSETHVTGFIRSYGKYLDLDPDQLIGVYKRIILQESPTPLEELTAPHKQRFNPGFFFVIFLIVVVISIPIYFLLDKKSGQSTDIFQPDEVEQEELDESLGQIYSRGESVPLKIAGQTIPLAFETVTREKVIVSLGGRLYEAPLGETTEFDFDDDGVVDVYLTIERISGQDFEATLTMGKQAGGAEEVVETADNKVILKSEERNEISLSISANGVSTINIQKDDNLQEDYFLKKGERVTISARDSLRLTATNPNNLILNLNRVALAIDTRNPAVDFLFKWRLNPGDGLYHLEYEQLR